MFGRQQADYDGRGNASADSPEARQADRLDRRAAMARHHPSAVDPDTRIQCPHCGLTGQVRTKEAKQKRGISGGKATGALLTGGVSILATGLSRKQKVTEAHCSNCESRWLL